MPKLVQLGHLVAVSALTDLFLRKLQLPIAHRHLIMRVALTLTLVRMVLVLSVGKAVRVSSIAMAVWGAYKTKNGGRYLIPIPLIATLKTSLH